MRTASADWVDNFQLVDMFPRTQKTVDMFPEPKVRTGRTVDMFLTAIMRTVKGNEYLNGSLVPLGVRSIDVKSKGLRGAERLENKRFIDLPLIEKATRSA